MILMFEKIKQKSKEAKNWVIENNEELKVAAYGVGMFFAGMVISSVIDKRKYDQKIDNFRESFSHELPILCTRKDSDYVDIYEGNDKAVTLTGLSGQLIEYGGVADSTVVGALVYTKKNSL